MHFKLSLVRLFGKHNLIRDPFRSTFASVATKERKSKPPPSLPKKTTVTNAARLSKELEEHFGTDKLADKYPPNLLKRCPQQTERFYLASPEVARSVGEFVTAGHSPDTLLVEVNPGPGLLSRELLHQKDKVGKLMLVENEVWFEEGLRKVVEAGGGDRVQLKFGDFNGQWKQIYLDSMDRGERLEKLLEGLPRTRWKDDGVNFRLFSIVGTMRFFKSLIFSLTNQRGLFELGRSEMVLVVPPLIYTNLTCSKDAGYKLYRSSSVLFQLFFEHQFLGKVPRKAFLPWPVNSNSNRKYQSQQTRLGLTGTDEWYVMRIVPRKDLFEYCLPDNLKLLAFFVTQNLVSRKNRIIPSLERWIPYCGARLILNQNYVPQQSLPKDTKNSESETPTFRPASSPVRANDFLERISIFTEFGELTPSQILTLFNEFINWPEFRQSPFLQSMEQNSSKQSFTKALVVEDEEEEEDGAAERTPDAPKET